MRLQWLTGMRPGEAVRMRTGDVDRTGGVWIHRPQHQPSEHHDVEREIMLGPKAQKVLAPFLELDPPARCSSDQHGPMTGCGDSCLRIKIRSMKKLESAVLALAACAASCATVGTAEEFQWTLEAPTAVDRGADLAFTVHSHLPNGEEVANVSYRYMVQWPGGRVDPIRLAGRTGYVERVRAGLQPGTATLVVTCLDKSGSHVKVAETRVDVK